MEAKPDFRSLRREEVRAHFAAWEEPAYRADQVYDWLWSKGAQSFKEMSNLPKALRIKLTEEFEFRPSALSRCSVRPTEQLRMPCACTTGLWWRAF